jgi:WD40 repeat protein
MIIDLAFSPDSTVLGFVESHTTDVDGLIYFVNMAPRLADRIRSNDILEGNRLRFNHAANWLLVGTETGMVTIYESGSLQQVRQLNVGEGGAIQAMAVSPDDRYLAAGANSTEIFGDNGFYLGSFDGEAILRLPYEEAGLSFGVAFNPIDPFVAYASTWRSPEGYVDDVRLFDTSTGQVLASCDSYYPFANDIAITHDGEWLIYSAMDGIRLWDMRDCDNHPDAWHILRPSEEDLFVKALALHPTEPILAVGYRDQRDAAFAGTIELWNFNSGELLTVLQGFADDTYSAIFTLAFSPDGTLLASGGADGTLRLWGIPAGNR